MITRGFLFILLLSGCSSDGSELPLAELGVTIRDAHGVEAPIACESLPLLPGARRHSEWVIDGKLTVTVFSSPGEVRVSFAEGARTLEAARVIPRDALETEYSDEVPLVLQEGDRYTALFSSECAP